jgi:hypothetical protein
LRDSKPISKSAKEKVHEDLVSRIKVVKIKNRTKFIDYMKSRGGTFSRIGDAKTYASKVSVQARHLS